MIRLSPDTIYTLDEVRKMFKKDRKTVRKMAARVGIPPFAQFFSTEQVRQMAVSR